MKRQPILLIAVVSLAAGLCSCDLVYRGVEGNIYEKMTIFSMIILTVFAILFVPFVSSQVSSKALLRFRELVRNASASPLSAAELTSHPVYFWDSRRSFRKMVFGADGALSESTIVTSNGVDPETRTAGSWEFTPTGSVRLSLMVTSTTIEFTRVSLDGYRLPTLLRLRSGYAQAWFLGEHGLAHAQIACFGYSQSEPPTAKFTPDLVSGMTVYWGSYPCLLPTSADELSVNPELAYGVMSFHDDGTLLKSINNPLDAPPDYRPTFTGTWRLDERLGVLNLSVGLYTTEITLHLHDPGRHTLLIGTTAGNEQWFLDPERGQQDLANYLAIGVYLDSGKTSLFL